MMKILDFFSKRNTGNTLAILVIAFFVLLGLIRLYPFVNTLKELIACNTNDDWVWYARFGLDIKEHGMPQPPASYRYPFPSGFLYYYFIALSFSIFGENQIPIYIIQHLMMGLSVALMYWTFRDKMRDLTSIIFLGALSMFTLLDVYRYYAVRLLSENLIFFIVPLFFFCFIRGFEKDNLKLQMASAFLMGSIILTRFSMILFGFVVILIIAPFYLKRRTKGIIYLLLFIIIMGLATSSLGIRNYLVSGKWNLISTYIDNPLEDMARRVHPIPESVDLSKIRYPRYARLNNIDKNISKYLEYMRQKPLLFFNHYAKKILFCFGFTSILNRNYRWRPHWMLMWIGYFTYLFLRIRDRQKMEMWEIAVQLYLFCYLTIVIIFAIIQNYGFRFLVPITNFVLIFSFLALDRLQGPRSALRDRVD